jgi:hypothetical protein
MKPRIIAAKPPLGVQAFDQRVELLVGQAPIRPVLARS